MFHDSKVSVIVSISGEKTVNLNKPINVILTLPYDQVQGCTLAQMDL